MASCSVNLEGRCALHGPRRGTVRIQHRDDPEHAEVLHPRRPFDVSGHPGMNVPCALSHGLPVGMMLVGGRLAESTIYRAAHAFEQLGDWREF